MSEPVLVETDGNVLVVTLNRPELMNALDGATVDALSRAWIRATEPDVRAVVLTGAGRGFCAGADIRSPRPADGRPAGLRHTYNPMVLQLAELKVPVVAAINGTAAGAGLALACAADLRIMSGEAKLVPSFAAIGLIPDAGGTYFLTRLLGYSRAFDWLSSGRPLLAPEALEMGLANVVVAPEEVRERAVARAHELAAMPGLGVPLLKEALGRAVTGSLAEQVDLEARLQEQALAAPGRAEARAAMVAKLKERSEERKTP